MNLDRRYSFSYTRNSFSFILGLYVLYVPIKDKSGRILLSDVEQDERWMEHFRETLNQTSPTDTHSFDQVTDVVQLQVSEDEITENETAEAGKIMKKGKSAGLDEISAELLKHGGSSLITELTTLFNNCWHNQNVPEDWQDGVIIKLPKKGDLTDCNNWRGITRYCQFLVKVSAPCF